MAYLDETGLSHLISKMKAAFWSKNDVVNISIDNTPTANSDNLVKSGGVKSYVDGAIPTVPTNVSAFTNDANYLTQHQDITGKQDVITAQNKLDYSLIDNTPTIPDITGKADKTTITTSSASTGSITLTDNNEYRFTASALTSLDITLPVSIGDNLDCWIAFNSGSTATSTTYPNTIKWSGDDVSNNIFVPLASKTYNIGIWYDGINVNAVVRGV